MRRVSLRAAFVLVVLIGVLGVLTGPMLAQSVQVPSYLPYLVWQAPAPETLSDAERAGILFVREEEKLARDVYLAMYDLWGLQIFQNIARSEQMHMDQMKALVDRYGLPDPVGTNGLGEFTDPQIQALYDKLVAQGRQSLADALYVGATIEEIDIVDLTARLGQTDKTAIITVYQDLRCGSGNHLRAFVPQWEGITGQTYEPQYLSPEVYAEIMAGNQAGCGGTTKGGP